MNEYGVGIVGFGNAAASHLKALLQVPRFRPAAVLSRRELEPERIRRDFGTRVRVYHDMERFLDDENIDVVDICTPHFLHAEQAVAAAAAGKALIIEKPIALRFADACSLLEAVERNGVKTSVCFEVRFLSVSQAMKSLIDRGIIGDVHYAECDYYHGIGPWVGQFAWNVLKDKAGSSLLTAGCHALDVLLWLVGGEVEEVFSYGTRSSHEAYGAYEYDTTSATLMKFRDGTLGKVVSAIDCMQPYYFNMNIVGSHGTLQNDRFFSRKIEGLAGWSHLNVDLPESMGDHPYRDQFAHFADCLDAGTEAMNNLASAFETHRVIFAADRSAETGKPISLKEFSR